MSEGASSMCGWCGKAFTPRSDGGQAQRFCRLACRRAFDAAGRRWVAEAMAAGMLTLNALRSGAVTTRALLPGAIPPAPVSQRGKIFDAADVVEDRPSVGPTRSF